MTDMGATTTADAVQLACHTCGQTVTVAIDVTDITPADGQVSVQVAMSRDGLDWIDAHQQPYVVPRPGCQEARDGS